MWDKRLLLFYPQCGIRHLDVISVCLLSKIRRLVLWGLRRYLTKVYGPNWCESLRTGRNKQIARLANAVSNLRNTDLQSRYLQGGEAGYHLVGVAGDHLVLKRLLSEAVRGKDVITRFTDASWWEWTRGSALVFWRWGEHVNLAVDGCPPFLLCELPMIKKKTPTPNKEKRLLIADKLKAIIE
jgi:hypothetical protein